jgi:methylamine dehydrogenase accessory protein MauD
MMTALVLSQLVIWLLLVGIIVALLAVARQVGVLHERIAPAGALTPRHGPAIGGKAPRTLSRSLDGRDIEIGGPLSAGSRRLIFFVSAQCPICNKLMPFVTSFARAEQVELVFAGDDRDDVQIRLVADAGLQDFAFLNDPALGRAFGVDKLPHAVLLGDDGTILSRGLVNSREHFESLIISAESGMQSVQQYIETRTQEHAH